ncbi:MAG: energy transducer TonB [Flavobacteriaceae bacterium]|jgi:hypothetical protein|nr:energy transducer TonB [Flavobacteriaceae bacterium]
MKKSLLLGLGGLLLWGGTTMYAQEVKDTPIDEEVLNRVYVAVQVKAEYPGGMHDFNKDFKSRLQVPEAFITDDKNLFRVIVMFIVERDGTLTDIKAVRNPGHGAGEETVRILKEMPKWNPAIHNGNTVRSQFTLPISVYKEDDASVFIDKKDVSTTPQFIAKAYRPEGIAAFKKQFEEEYTKRITLSKSFQTFLIDFVVELDGTLSDISAIDATTLVENQEVADLIKELGKWKPCRVNNKPIRSIYHLSIGVNK